MFSFVCYRKKKSGRAIPYAATIEFQKRGLPLFHILITLHPEDSLKTSKLIDIFISAEIPEYNLELKNVAIKHMLHGSRSEKTPCYDVLKNTCSKSFPKSFQEQTSSQTNGYPLTIQR